MTLGFTNNHRPAIRALAAPAPKITVPEEIEVIAEPPKAKKAKKVKTTPAEVLVANSAPKAAKGKKRIVVKVHVKSKRLRSLLKLDKASA